MCRLWIVSLSDADRENEKKEREKLWKNAEYTFETENEQRWVALSFIPQMVRRSRAKHCARHELGLVHVACTNFLCECKHKTFFLSSWYWCWLLVSDLIRNSQNVAIELDSFGSWINLNWYAFVFSSRCEFHIFEECSRWAKELNEMKSRRNPCSCRLCDKNMPRIFHLAREFDVHEIGKNGSNF